MSTLLEKLAQASEELRLARIAGESEYELLKRVVQIEKTLAEIRKTLSKK